MIFNFTAEDVIIEDAETSSKILDFTIYNIMNKYLKTFASYLYLITCLWLHRKFGNVISDIVQEYKHFDSSQLCKLEKISIKIGKAELDIRFLNNC